MSTYATQLAADYMQAYYKVATKRFIDDVSVLAVEEQLMRRLPQIFDTDAVDRLSDDDVLSLASESEATALDRNHNREKLALLETTLHELQRFHNCRTEFSDVNLDDTPGDTEDFQQDLSPVSGTTTPVSQQSCLEVPEAEVPPSASAFEPWHFNSAHQKKQKKKKQVVPVEWAD